jgi:hypothetical protein
LAKRAGVSGKVVLKLEAGLPVRLESLRKVIEGLGLTVEEA